MLRRCVGSSLIVFGVVVAAGLPRHVSAQVYDIALEAHFPDATVPFNSEDNPLAGNVWVYGHRDTGAGGVNQVLWNDNSFDVFKPFDFFQQQGADVIGGAGSLGDINTACSFNFVNCDAGGNGGAQVKIIDYGSGPAAHVVAGADSFVKGTVHLFTDDDAPTDRAAIIRFAPPAPGSYKIDVLFENRANSGLAGDKPTYHAVVARGGGIFETFDVLSEGFLDPKVFNGNLGLGNGTFVEVHQTVTLGANDFIELAGMGSGAFPGVPIAVVGTIEKLSSGDPSGDYNENGFVDTADYVLWRNTLNDAVASPGDGADGNKSGTIDAGDYDYWKARFGNTAPGSSAVVAVSVPEPATLSIAAFGTLLWALQFSRRRPPV
jgi:hypothetical protein